MCTKANSQNSRLTDYLAHNLPVSALTEENDVTGLLAAAFNAVADNAALKGLIGEALEAVDRG